MTKQGEAGTDPLAAAREALRNTPVNRARANSKSEQIRALIDDIAAARLNGARWADVEAALKDTVGAGADTIRQVIAKEKRAQKNEQKKTSAKPSRPRTPQRAPVVVPPVKRPVEQVEKQPTSTRYQEVNQEDFES